MSDINMYPEQHGKAYEAAVFIEGLHMQIEELTDALAKQKKLTWAVADFLWPKQGDATVCEEEYVDSEGQLRNYQCVCEAWCKEHYHDGTLDDCNCVDTVIKFVEAKVKERESAELEDVFKVLEQ
jgi:hypothetical protein